MLHPACMVDPAFPGPVRQVAVERANAREELCVWKGEPVLLPADSAMASWRPNAAASAYHSGELQGPQGLARQSSIARYDSASSEVFHQYSTVDPLTGLPPQPGAPMHAQHRRYDSGLEGLPPSPTRHALLEPPDTYPVRQSALHLQ